MDTERWDHVPFRAGDIVISTPPKCGTTWTQMICALLIFQTTELPRPLDAISPWPDALTHRLDDVLADLEKQPHRRFMKTHTPLDGLPFDDRVTYICVARDPRDVAISWDNHIDNADLDVAMAMRAAAVGMDDLDPSTPTGLPERSESARDRFWSWIDNDGTLVGLSALCHHLSTFWQVRDEPNVLLLHYGEMKTDLEGQMRGLAARLGIEIPEQRWPELLNAASFEAMRARAHDLAPELPLWRDPHRFFHRGTSGQWRDLLDQDDLRRYETRVRELFAPDLAEWVHRGSVVT
ncbi:sulfotransferase domain-containing protein [Micromonospora sp. KC606]|uniref:sulfotransferase domain-containing protein n=1 Tax=Micromonospora sp. KC606 TaxID=2530379 RepID=UPI0010535BD7|nr:sulfotransferase domain-containing protein [Micromonospora sp. KC606]TDC85419.1 sulfotransferase domain-containing protein [Micromonospora sp. KC606]